MARLLAAALDECTITANELSEVDQIEQRAYAFPWTFGNLADSLRAGHAFLGLRMNGALIAYSIVMPVLDEAHLLNLTVAPEMQGRGLGHQMLRTVLRVSASTLAARSLLLEVRPSNAAALALYRAQGFQEIGRRKHYYPARHGREDALVLRRRLP